MEGAKVIPLSFKKYMFPGLLLLVMVMVLVLFRRLGGGGVMVIHEALTGLAGSSDIRLSHAETGDKWHGDGHKSPDDDHHRHLSGSAHSHVHDKEVHFVLHESALGAPEFIGRNDRKATFIDFDPAGTFLNAPGHAVAEIFHSDNYKEKNIAIGLAITTREQEVSKETLAKELPFFTVYAVFTSLSAEHIVDVNGSIHGLSSFIIINLFNTFIKQRHHVDQHQHHTLESRIQNHRLPKQRKHSCDW